MLMSVYYTRSRSQSSCIFFQKSQSSKGLLTRETAQGGNVLFFDRNCANESYKIKDQENLNDNCNLRKAAIQPQVKQPRKKKSHCGFWVHIPGLSPPAPVCSIKADSGIRFITEVSQGPLLTLGMISASHHLILMESR